ncbi:MAG: LytTR family DNA-binding domain-containing protein [Pseudomonadota bacterium]
MPREAQSYTCIVVDDEPLGRELIETHLQQFDQIKLVASCASAIKANRFLSEHRVDLMFLDIEMPVMKGTEFIRSLKNPPKVIFTTAYRDYAVDGFDLEAVDYLLKPIVFARFFQAIERFLKTQNRPSEIAKASSESLPHIFVRKDRKEMKLVLDDILYVRSLRDYLEIHTKNGSHTIKSSISEFSERLGAGFVRIHRSYLVNQRYVTAVTRHDVEIGETELPIGEQFRKPALLRLGVS